MGGCEMYPALSALALGIVESGANAIDWNENIISRGVRRIQHVAANRIASPRLVATLSLCLYDAMPLHIAQMIQTARA